MPQGVQKSFVSAKVPSNVRKWAHTYNPSNSEAEAGGLVEPRSSPHHCILDWVTERDLISKEKM